MSFSFFLLFSRCAEMLDLAHDYHLLTLNCSSVCYGAVSCLPRVSRVPLPVSPVTAAPPPLQVPAQYGPGQPLQDQPGLSTEQLGQLAIASLQAGGGKKRPRESGDELLLVSITSFTSVVFPPGREPRAALPAGNITRAVVTSK